MPGNGQAGSWSVGWGPNESLDNEVIPCRPQTGEHAAKRWSKMLVKGCVAQSLRTTTQQIHKSTETTTKSSNGRRRINFETDRQTERENGAKKIDRRGGNEDGRKCSNNIIIIISVAVIGLFVIKLTKEETMG